MLIVRILANLHKDYNTFTHNDLSKGLSPSKCLEFIMSYNLQVVALSAMDWNSLDLNFVFDLSHSAKQWTTVAVDNAAAITKKFLSTSH